MYHWLFLSFVLLWCDQIYGSLKMNFAIRATSVTFFNFLVESALKV